MSDQTGCICWPDENICRGEDRDAPGCCTYCADLEGEEACPADTTCWIDSEENA